MVTKSKMSHGIDSANAEPFKFSDSFLESFKSITDAYDASLKELNSIISNEIDKFAYGICNCSYKIRYITPDDISAYISYLAKGLNNGIFNTISDIDMFTVASVKRCIEDHGCSSFESTDDIMTGRGMGGKYVNPKEYTTFDLINLCKNDIPNKTLCSHYEVTKRADVVKEHVEMFNKMHFGITLKNIVNSFPSLMKRLDSSLICINPIYKEAFTTFIETFITFACSFNMLTIEGIIGYCKPSTTYKLTPENEHNNKIVTECCLIKTNDMRIRSRIPFNCNMRDIVLQDVHPKFNDTKSALHFILHDSRSPISVLVNKYSKNEECPLPVNPHYIAKMFIGRDNDDYPCDLSSTEWTDQKGHYTGDPYKKYNVHTNVEWLDRIAYGNNYLDGNYRDDAMGNEHSHSITKTFDMIYKMFSGCDLTTNEDIAENIKQVASMMVGIIDAYSTGDIENWDLVKDTLALFGEIFTRNMLRLYYNNTRVFVFDDKADDAMTPGYLYTESFYMEAGEKTDTPTVSFKNSDGTDIKNSISTKISIGQTVRKFLDWIRSTLSKFFTKFNENHKAEIDYITKNDDTNKKISEAITDGSFVPVVSNFPKFKIPASEISKINVGNVVTKYLSSKAPIEEKAVLREMLPQGMGDTSIVVMAENEDKAKEYISNYALYSTLNKPDAYNGKLSVDLWNDLIDNIKGSPKLIETESKAISDDLTKALDMLSNKLKDTPGDDQNKDPNKVDETARARELFTIVQKVSRIYQTNVLNTFNSKFFSSSYKIYRDIVAGYKQQGSPTKKEENPSTQQSTNPGEQTNAEDIKTPET